MKRKWTPHIIAVVALVVFIGLGLACGSTQSSGGSYSGGGGSGCSKSYSCVWAVKSNGAISDAEHCNLRSCRVNIVWSDFTPGIDVRCDCPR